MNKDEIYDILKRLLDAENRLLYYGNVTLRHFLMLSSRNHNEYDELLKLLDEEFCKRYEKWKNT